MSKRNYKAEYARRIARGNARGLTRTQARGHSRAREPTVATSKPIEDDRLQLALRVLREEKNFAAAARTAKIAPERLRRYAVDKGLIEKDGRRWRVAPNLPRRMLVYSNGRSLPIVVTDFDTASAIGRYMSAVRRFLETNNRALLAPFAGQEARDASGKAYPFETRPNALYRLAASDDHSFEQIYRIVV